MLEEIVRFTIALLCFILGQVFHLAKKYKLEKDEQVWSWLKQNKILFVATTILGLALIETILYSGKAMEGFQGWIELVYQAFISGFGGSSLAYGIPARNQGQAGEAGFGGKGDD